MTLQRLAQAFSDAGVAVFAADIKGDLCGLVWVTAMVQRVLVAAPQSRIGPLSDAERAALIAGSPLVGRYDKPIDRESALSSADEPQRAGARARCRVGQGG